MARGNDDMRHALRRASLALFAAMLGTLSVPGTTSAYSLTSWSWNEPIKLKLTDGREIEGRFRGVLGRTSDPGSYADQYAKWRAERGADAVPALGDTLVVTRATGEPVRGPLRGFADKRLLLGTGDSCLGLTLPLKGITEVRLAGEPAVAPPFAAHQGWKSAPSLYSVTIETEGGAFAVPVSMVASREMLPAARASNTTTLVVGVLVGVVLLAGAAAAAMASSFSQPMF
jgi:hypothetical protein